MKHVYFFVITALSLLSGVVLPACGEDEPEADATVSVASGVSTDIVLEHFDVMEVNAVAFNSTGDWSAEIYSANSSFDIVESKTFSQVDWLEINPFKGGAGEIRCTLFATPNQSGEARYAVIKVYSPTNSIVFRVTQRGTAQQGGDDTPVPIPGGSVE